MVVGGECSEYELAGVFVVPDCRGECEESIKDTGEGALRGVSRSSWAFRVWLTDSMIRQPKSTDASCAAQSAGAGWIWSTCKFWHPGGG